MRSIVDDILTWPWFSEPHGYNFNGHLVRHPDGNICIDPVEPTQDDLDALVGEVEAAEKAGMTAPQAIADHFNAKGLTTRKGRRWTGATMAKFLGSPGAKRYRSG